MAGAQKNFVKWTNELLSWISYNLKRLESLPKSYPLPPISTRQMPIHPSKSSSATLHSVKPFLTVHERSCGTCCVWTVVGLPPALSPIFISSWYLRCQVVQTHTTGAQKKRAKPTPEPARKAHWERSAMDLTIVNRNFKTTKATHTNYRNVKHCRSV